MANSLFQILHIMASLTMTPLSGPTAQESVVIPAAKPQTPLFYRPPLHQWPRVQTEYETMIMAYEACAAKGRRCVSEEMARWLAHLDALRGEKRLDQLMAVNRYINAHPYKQDNWVYAASDHWAAPPEFLEKSGDCEDFAIAKYFSLRRLGFDANDMQVLLVYDVYSGTDHAVLRVALDNNIYFLDNREDLIDRAGFEKRYRPHVAFNENDVHMYEQPLMARSIRGGDERILPGNR